MANLNKTLCNCEGTYNEQTGFCDPLLPNSPNPCPDTTWGNIWNWLGQNVTIGQGGYNQGGGFNYTPPGYEKKDNTIWYIVGGVVVIAVIYFATKKK